MRRLITGRHIRICSVCHSAFQFRLKPLFASVKKSKFKNGRVHFRNSGIKGLINIVEYIVEQRTRRLSWYSIFFFFFFFRILRHVLMVTVVNA